MGVDDGLFADSALQILKIGFVIHEKVLGKFSWAQSVSQDIEVFFPVGVAVGVVSSDALAWEVFYSSFAQAFC